MMNTFSANFPGNRHPPKAPLAIRIGIVGHRPDRLPDSDMSQLGNVLAQILSIIQIEVLQIARTHSDLFQSQPPQLRALSSLAEGSDRAFAEQALRAGYELTSILPFEKQEYERDFAEGVALEAESLNRFRSLLSKGTSCFELDGSRAQPERAYGVAGVVLLIQSDLIIIVWDGERKGKLGGTEEMIDVAKSIGLPFLVVDAKGPHAWQFEPQSAAIGQDFVRRRVKNTESQEDNLRASIRSLVLPSHLASADESTKGRSLKDGQHPTLLGLYRFYRERIIVDPLPTPQHDEQHLRESPQTPIPRSPLASVTSNDPTRDPTSIAHLQQIDYFQLWPDQLAVKYARRYRVTFVTAFLLSAFAVAMALLPQGLRWEDHHLAETICIAAELVAILIIIGLVFFGRRGGWHERWLDYRLAAELLRHLRIVAPFGGAPAIPQLPAHWATYGQPSATWMAWYSKAVERSLGCPTARVNHDYLSSCLTQLRNFVEQQSRYHAETAMRSERTGHQLHLGAMLLLVLTLLACGGHLLPVVWHSLHVPKWVPPMLTFACGFFPAFGAALAGISNQGEYRRIGKRSEAMHEHLETIQAEILTLKNRLEQDRGGSEQYSITASSLARRSADLLLDEVLDRRVVLLDRPVVPPS